MYRNVVVDSNGLLNRKADHAYPVNTLGCIGTHATCSSSGNRPAAEQGPYRRRIAVWGSQKIYLHASHGTVG